MKKPLLIVAAVILIGVAWFLFRPEKLFISESVNEGFPQAVEQAQADTPRLLLEGRFHGVAHETQGTVAIFELPDGKRVLRLTDFETSNGPDVRVYLGEAKDANDNDTVTEAGYIELGPLKGNVGNQNYDVPAEIDLGNFGSVTIWCKRFGVNFGTAPLMAAR